MPRAPDHEKRLDLARRAVAVLEREGLGLSTERLAAALGVKRPTLLYHFPTVSHLVEAALVELLSQQAAYVIAEIERHAHPIDRLYAQLRAVHAFHEGREARLVFLTQAIAASGGARVPEILERGTQVFDAFRRAAADRVREGIRAGIVAPCDADALVVTVRALIDGLMIHRVTSPTLALPPVHAFVWDRLLAPLKLAPRAAATAPAPAPTPTSASKPASKPASRSRARTKPPTKS
ncbi:MAG TPA: TetR family transcriptional regulator [Polyangiaceae bacterium]|nr:TetR family transcriptional regulator [Polyangiaceae bacterium]